MIRGLFHEQAHKAVISTKHCHGSTVAHLCQGEVFGGTYAQIIVNVSQSRTRMLGVCDIMSLQMEAFIDKCIRTAIPQPGCPRLSRQGRDMECIQKSSGISRASHCEDWMCVSCKIQMSNENKKFANSGLVSFKARLPCIFQDKIRSGIDTSVCWYKDRGAKSFCTDGM